LNKNKYSRPNILATIVISSIPTPLLDNIGQGVTKRCRLSWLTISALVYEPKCGGMGGCGMSAHEYNCPHGVQINSGDLTPYLTYDIVKATQREKRFRQPF
jgi:hypothetical protein